MVVGLGLQISPRLNWLEVAGHSGKTGWHCANSSSGGDSGSIGIANFASVESARSDWGSR